MSIEKIVEDLRAIEAYGELPISSYEAGNYADEIEALLAENTKLKERQINTEPVRHGHWVECTLVRSVGNLNGLKCSLCEKEKVGKFVKYNYCPNCGAKMDEVSE